MLSRGPNESAFNKNKIINRLVATWIVPFNRFRIPEERFAPSLVTDRPGKIRTSLMNDIFRTRNEYCCAKLNKFIPRYYEKYRISFVSCHRSWYILNSVSFRNNNNTFWRIIIQKWEPMLYSNHSLVHHQSTTVSSQSVPRLSIWKNMAKSHCQPLSDQQLHQRRNCEEPVSCLKYIHVMHVLEYENYLLLANE